MSTRSDTLADLSTLVRLEAARLRAFWRFALRDWVFVVGVVLMIPVVVGGLREGFHQRAAHLPPLQLAAAFAVVGALALIMLAAGGAAKVQMLWDGPFHALLLEPGRARAWTLVRAIASFAPLSVILATIAATVRLAAAAPVFAGLWAGAAIGAVWAAVASRRAEAAEPIEKPTRPDRIAFTNPAAIIAHATVRERGAAALSALALVVVGGLAAGLAQRNNHVAGLGELLCAIAALLAGALVQPRAPLTALLGQQPIGFFGLFAWLYALPLSTAALGGFIAALAAGLGSLAGLRAGFGAVTFLFGLAWFAFLHRLIRSPRTADQALVLEAAGMMLMASVETSLAPLWVLGRGAILVRAARRRRWLHR